MPRRGFRPALPAEFVPTTHKVIVPPRVQNLLEGVHSELALMGARNRQNCWGYFPDLAPDPDNFLPRSQAFAASLATVTVAGKNWDFSWVRLSYGASHREPQYHLDADRGSGTKGNRLDQRHIPTNIVWRLLVNLSPSVRREVKYLNVDANALKWRREQGAVVLSEDEEINSGEERLVVLPKRIGSEATAAAICVSRVAHAGHETPQGHFLASWSREEIAG